MQQHLYVAKPLDFTHLARIRYYCMKRRRETDAEHKTAEPRNTCKHKFVASTTVHRLPERAETKQQVSDGAIKQHF